MYTLRDDQQELSDSIDREQAAGAANVLAVLPTGGGKSVIMSSRILRDHAYGWPQLVAAHRTELVGQMSMHVATVGIPHRIIAPKKIVSQITAAQREKFGGRSFIKPDSICTVGAVDTIMARRDELKAWAAQQRRWRIDEAHHVLRSNKWGDLTALLGNAYGEGYTASPKRADGQGLGRHHDGVFDAMVLGPDMRSLINIGALCDYRIAIEPSDLTMDGEEVAPSGDWSPAKLKQRAKKSRIVGDVVREYVKHAYGKRAICFATDVEKAAEIAKKFCDVGIPAMSVSGTTPAEVREDAIKRFKDGRIWILVNVDLFDEGFDVPAVEVVIMARPTASLAKYLQMFGRALRTMPGKLYGLVIDHVGNFKRHGPPDKAHDWSLDRREKSGKKKPLDPELIETISCKGCSRPYERALPQCPYCGWMPPIDAEPSRRTIEQVDGDLVLLGPEQLAELRSATQLESPASIMQRVASAAGANAGAGAMNRQMERVAAQQRLREAIAVWAGIQRWKGRTDQESYRRFYLTTGVDAWTAQTLSRVEMEKLAESVEEWCSK